MDAAQIENDLTSVVLTNEEIQDRILEIAAQIDVDYSHCDQPLLMVGVLKGAVMVMADLARAVSISVELDFMAVSSYGSGTKSSGVVRIIKDLDIDLAGRDVLIVEDILDSGLTLSWLIKNLKSRHPNSLEVMTMMRKPDAIKIEVPAKYIGFDIPNEFVVGFGLDYAEKYRNLREVGILAPHVYGG
ncbi:MAG: hypoxanthine phosphoribosyltransferase [Candidatus Nanopelagicales bacterium]|jgi:hypoxanthine phosphoribosyltransferase|nr:hypoxanthine phosphoribosyltransferase [Candidatus Nanopelagicales bacterium]MDP4666948.1 hypoxanthine phosphoribosyltransferase [Candidatus Nanopelagicales bacterium]MDP4895906.1 hypoxanthine phosphoribosyltransferase [Candidatus Nanopelagicales bacterium]MDP5050777.1 hypoxanthine phosphoribosyltransferase [Candidatus Nanopelagicales bacterium]